MNATDSAHEPTVFVVDDDHYPAVAEIFNNLFYTIQNRAFCHFV